MEIYENIKLSEISWIKIGGICKKLIVINSYEDLLKLSREYISKEKPFDIIGWTSNTLFSDSGISHDLFQIKSTNVEIGYDKNKLPQAQISRVESRHKVFKTSTITSGYDTSDIEYDEVDGEEVIVKVDSGVGLSYLINFLIERGIVGLHYFSGIPGSVGAAVINNIHGGPKSFSEYVYAVEFLDTDGTLKILPNQEMKFAYDYSVLQHSGAVVLAVYLLLRYGDIVRAKRASIGWAYKKATQPKNSLGSAFQNLTKEQQEKLNLPTPGVAYLIEHVLKLSGYRVGDIMIPEQTPPDQVQINKNIIINVGKGCAEDYYAVLDKVWTEAEKIGIRLKTEIHFKGFEKDRIQKFLG